MDDELKLKDGKQYYFEFVLGKPHLDPERRALVEADLANGEDSLVRQYLTLELRRRNESRKLMNEDGPDVLRWSRDDVELGMPRTGGGDLNDMPLSEYVAGLRERLNINPWGESLGLDEGWRASLDGLNSDWRHSLERDPDDDRPRHQGGRRGRGTSRE